jgi:hypothetical protein
MGPASECRSIQAIGFLQRGSHEKLARSADIEGSGNRHSREQSVWHRRSQRMDENINRVLHDAFRAGMTEPSFQEVLVRLNQEPRYLSSEDYRNYALKTIEDEKRAVRELGLKAE